MHTINNLNKIQQEATISTDGPVLVLAGAGTGKTTVLTSRIKYIIENNLANMSQILAITFTNKAAKEIKDRIGIIDEPNFRDPDWFVGTFHSTCLRIIRRHIDSIEDLRSGFMIVDDDDSSQVIKNLLKDMEIDDSLITAKEAKGAINKWKDSGIYYKDTYNPKGKVFSNSEKQIKAWEIYIRYQEIIINSNRIDFGDIILLCVRLFENNPEILEQWSQKFRYILVDEYQDTNFIQAKFAKLLSRVHGNIFVVGDDDQAIYSWRGADVGNIISFKDKYKDVKVITLQDNYRSTANIINAAKAIIKKNAQRFDKNLISHSSDNDKVTLYKAHSSYAEARFIADTIFDLNQKFHISYSKFSILIRSAYQSRDFEDAFNERFMPYRILGGVKFYERKEIKDSLAYLRLIISKDNNLDFERVINVPKRGLGPKTLGLIKAVSAQNGISMFSALEQMLKEDSSRTKRFEPLKSFVQNINMFHNMYQDNSFSQGFIINCLDSLGYFDYISTQPNKDERIDNIGELDSLIQQYNSIEDFLEHIALVTDADFENAHSSSNEMINIMTMHRSKGLEFDYVFLPAWEEGVFPSAKSLNANSFVQLEEERRLAYVAITRAKKRVAISYSDSRYSFGRTTNNPRSRFIGDIPASITMPLNKLEGPAPDREKIRANYGSSYGYNKSSSKFNIGDTVVHQSFGEGVVVGSSGPSIEVDFDGGYVRTIFDSFLSKQ